jgi:two-component system chemotaxis response regulator CheY
MANDDADLLEACREVLNEGGHEVRSVASGREAFGIALDWQPDLVIVDWVMPDMDGTTLITELRKDAATASLRILMISGSVNARVMAGRVGSDGFLPKPFQADELLEAVARLVDATDPTFTVGP